MTEIRKFTLKFPSLRAFLAEYGERISADGMLLRGASPPAAGSMVDIEVVVAAGMRLLRARGETLWSGAAGIGSEQQAAAIRFEELDPASRKLIDKIVEQRRREGAELFRLADVPSPREARLRDLTVPVATISAELAPSVTAPTDSIFDLAEPPVTSGADLFSSSDASTAASSSPAAERPAGAGEPVAANPAALAADRRPVPPVPLLAEPESEPFDLAPQPPIGSEEVENRSQADLSDLFGGDEPQAAPARGRTEAFPPSFVDEVEAELRATDGTKSSYLEVDTGELEVQLGGPADDPELVSPAPIEQPREATMAGPTEVEPSSEPAIAPEPAAAMPGDAPSASEPLPLPEMPGVSAARREVSPVEVLGPEEMPALEAPEPEVREPEVPSSEVPEPEVPEPEVPEPEVPEPEVPELEVPSSEVPEPEVPSAEMPGLEVPVSAASIPEAPSPEMLAPEPPAREELSPQVAGAFSAAHGPETVELPILASPPADLGSSPAPPPAVEAPAPAVEPRPPVGNDMPAVGEPVSPVEIPLEMDDNLLSIPELNADSSPGEPAAIPRQEEDLPSSAQALRGAAGRSRHAGTWFLIALLAAALAVAGYVIMGLVRGADGGPPEPEVAVDVPAPKPVPPVSPPEESPVDPVAPISGEGAAATPAGAVVEPSVTTEATEPDTAAPPSPEPPTPLTGLNRITWSETDTETVLAIVGDGEIARQSVELTPIGGGQPRLVIKISGVQRPFQPAVLEVGTSHVVRVRTGLHAGGQLHIVVDLAAGGVSVRDLATRGSRLEVRLGAD